MPSRDDDGLASTLAAFDRLRVQPRKAIAPVLVQEAEALAAAQRFAAPKKTGALAESIAVTPPGGTTPAYSQPGGSRVAGASEAIVTAGDTDVRYAHLVEFGTVKMEAEPFFWPIYRLMRARMRNRINRAARQSIRNAWKGVRP